jgi:predicted dithiol-disulfide oxidoreductase (DUF899 family)
MFHSFEGPDGKARLLDLFEGRRQLIVYHFMLDPGWDKGCPGCTGFVDALPAGGLRGLATRVAPEANLRLRAPPS